MEESILAPRTNIVWNAVLTVVAIVGLTEFLLILPWDIRELRNIAFMNVWDLARANFEILDITERAFDLVTGVLLGFWAIAGLAAGSRSRHTIRGVISGLLGAIFVAGVVVVEGNITGVTTTLPTVGIALGAGTATIVGGIGGALTTSPAKSMMKQKTARIWTKDEKWVCPNCGADLPPGAFVCPSCGTDAIE